MDHHNIWMWVDLETTGLDKRKSEICEAAIVVTTPELDQLGSFHAVLDAREGYWHPEALAMHKTNGLYEDMAKPQAIAGTRQERYSTLKVMLNDFLGGYQIYSDNGNPLRYNMAGSSVHFDRSIIENHLSQDWVERFFHHVMIDVSSIKADIRAQYGSGVFTAFDSREKTKSNHRAMDDILRSIDLLEYCRSVTALVKSQGNSGPTE